MEYTFLHPDIETRHLTVRKDDPKWLGYWMDYLHFNYTHNELYKRVRTSNKFLLKHKPRSTSDVFKANSGQDFSL